MQQLMAIVRNREDEVYAAVVAGEIVIQPDGTCWRVACRQGFGGRKKRSKGETRLFQCAPRRAEDLTPAGYLQVRLQVDGRRCHAAAHRLVWRHFFGPLPVGNKGIVKHKNNNRQDNRPSNLYLQGGK